MIFGYKSNGSFKNRPGLVSPTYPGTVIRRDRFPAIKIIIALVIVFGLLLTVFGLLKLTLFAPKPSPLASLEVSSEPPGASISLNGKKLGLITPGQVPLSEGYNKIVLDKKDYASYTFELEVKRDLTTLITQTAVTKSSVSTPLTPALSHVAVKNIETGAKNQSRKIPTFSIKAKLSLAVAEVFQLPTGLPNFQILKARYLPALPDFLEISEQVEGNGSLDAGVEGIASGLWIYDPASRLSHPVVVASYALNQMLRYYGLSKPGATDLTSNNLSRLNLTAPILSPDGRHLAIISRLLPDPNPSFSTANLKNHDNSNLEEWNTQTTWILPVSKQVSASGAWLAGVESPLGPDSKSPTDASSLADDKIVNVASLKDLEAILPGLKTDQADTRNAGNIGNPLLTKEFASFEEISWNPAGNQLLIVVELARANNFSSASGSTVLVTAEMSPGNLRLATPLPLPVTVLPGTVKWSEGSEAISFLVQESNQAIGLCVLSLEQTAQAAAVNPDGQPGKTPENPFRYLGRLAGQGIWAGSPDYASNSKNNGGQSLPPSFGSARYNTFAWAGLKGQPNKFLLGAYGEIAPTWAIGSNQEFNTLYGYFPFTPNNTQLVKELEPLTLDRKKLEADSGNRNNLSEDSYPLWVTGLYQQPHLIYLSGRIAQSSGGFLGGNTYLEISLNELNLQNTPFGSLLQTSVNLPEIQHENNQDSTSSNTQTTKVTLLRAYSDRIKLPAFEDIGTNDFEAEINPDGTGAIIALPGSRGNRKVQFWLANWD